LQISLLELQLDTLDLIMTIAEAQLSILEGTDIKIGGVSVAAMEISLGVATLRQKMIDVDTAVQDSTASTGESLAILGNHLLGGVTG
jgi:hypothetical protein